MKTEGGEKGGTGGNSRGEEGVGRWGEREVIAEERRGWGDGGNGR